MALLSIIMVEFSFERKISSIWNRAPFPRASFSNFCLSIFIVFQWLRSRYEKISSTFILCFMQTSSKAGYCVITISPYFSFLSRLVLSDTLTHSRQSTASNPRKSLRQTSIFCFSWFHELIRTEFSSFLIYLFSFQIHSINLLSLPTPSKCGNRKLSFPRKYILGVKAALSIPAANLSLCENNF